MKNSDFILSGERLKNRSSNIRKTKDAFFYPFSLLNDFLFFVLYLDYRILSFSTSNCHSFESPGRSNLKKRSRREVEIGHREEELVIKP